MITYKGIEHERFGDAPFIGALIIASQCYGTCKNCFNQHLKEEANCFANVEKLLDEVESNPLNEGIILGGLEWTDTPDEFMELLTAALWRSDRLQIMLYTRLTEEELFTTFPKLQSLGPIWIKFGAYKEELKSDMYYSHGVQLATMNQYIKLFNSKRK